MSYMRRNDGNASSIAKENQEKMNGMVRENESYSLIRLNKDEAVVPESFGDRAIGIGGDMEKAISDLKR